MPATGWESSPRGCSVRQETTKPNEAAGSARTAFEPPDAAAKASNVNGSPIRRLEKSDGIGPSGRLRAEEARRSHHATILVKSKPTSRERRALRRNDRVFEYGERSASDDAYAGDPPSVGSPDCAMASREAAASSECRAVSTKAVGQRPFLHAVALDTLQAPVDRGGVTERTSECHNPPLGSGFRAGARDRGQGGLTDRRRSPILETPTKSAH